MSILKKLTGTQPLRMEQKGQPAYDAIIYAKHFFNANELPLLQITQMHITEGR